MYNTRRKNNSRKRDRNKAKSSCQYIFILVERCNFNNLVISRSFFWKNSYATRGWKKIRKILHGVKITKEKSSHEQN